MAAWALWMLWGPARARAQPGAEAAPIISVHPDVSTSLQLPDEIEGVRSADNHDIMVGGVGSVLYLRPRPNTPAGVEVFIEVKTRTLHRFFLVRVVEHAGEATERLVVPAAGPAQAAPQVSPAAPTPPEPAERPATPEPMPVPVPAAPAPDTPAPATAPAEPEPPTTAITERPSGPGSSRFAVSVHAVAFAGTTAFHIQGYDAISARQPHRAAGIRVIGRRPGASWGVEANVSGEWPGTPTTHFSRDEVNAQEIAVSGPRLRADVGLTASFGRRLMPTFHGGIGLQAHHLDIDVPESSGGNDRRLTRDLPFEGVMTLGMGLEYRAGNMLLGIELHVRQGVLAGYRSVSGIVSVGFFLDQGEEP